MKIHLHHVLRSAWLAGGLIAGASLAGMPEEGPKQATMNLAQITLLSPLKPCLDLEKKALQEHADMLFLIAKATARSSVGQCGCTSRLIGYRVIEKLKMDDGHVENYERAFGIVAAPGQIGENKNLTMVLKSDPDLIFRGTIAIELACKQTDRNQARAHQPDRRISHRTTVLLPDFDGFGRTHLHIAYRVRAKSTVEGCCETPSVSKMPPCQ